MLIGKECKEFLSQTIVPDGTSGIVVGNLFELFRFYLNHIRSTTKVHNTTIFLPLVIMFLELKDWDYITQPRRFGGTLIRGIGFASPRHEKLANVLTQGITVSEAGLSAIRTLTNECYGNEGTSA